MRRELVKEIQYKINKQINKLIKHNVNFELKVDNRLVNIELRPVDWVPTVPERGQQACRAGEAPEGMCYIAYPCNGTNYDMPEECYVIEGAGDLYYISDTVARENMRWMKEYGGYWEYSNYMPD